MTIRRLATAAAALVVGASALALPASQADSYYDDPFLVNWPALLPGAPATYDATLDTPASTEGTWHENGGARTRGPADNDCVIGSIGCVDNVVAEMTARWRALRCDHNAIFAFVYLLTTIQYRDSALTPGFYSDVEFLNHYDTVFGDAYFDAIDAWAAGDVSRVDPAWRVAFEAADTNLTTGYGDMVLGMNAHILNDLPFVIERIGLVSPEGESRHADHSKVNVFLNAAGKIVVDRASRVHDESLQQSDRVKGTDADSSASLQLVFEWREEAWRMAEVLHYARNQGPDAYAAAAAYVRGQAGKKAELLRDTNKATPAQTATRDAFCDGAFPEAGSAEETAILAPYKG